MFLPHDNTPPSDHVDGMPEAHNSTIHQAAANDDLARVSQLLDGGVDVNGRDQARQTALHQAIYNDSSTMVRLLLSRGADTSLRDDWEPDWPDGFIPVETAAHLNARAAMQELLAHGVNIEASDAVYVAARENHAKMLKLLFDTTESSMSDMPRQQGLAIALRESAGQRSSKLVLWVLEMRGDERALDDYWQGALDCAFLQVFEGLIALPPSFHYQEYDLAIQVLEILIEAGASINAHTDDSLQCTALSLALQLDSPLRIVAFLLDYGADVNLCAPGEHSPFSQLLEDPQATEELMKMFIDAGAVISPPDARGQTVLHCVRKANIGSWLLTSGANLSAVDDEGETPLHKASSRSNFDLVSLYLEAGTPIDQRNNLGWTPFMQSSSASISKALLDHGANIHAASDQGITAIHHAAKACNLELVSLLLANGADIHVLASREDRVSDPIVEHNTPLHLAVASAHGASMGGALQLVTALLDYGADIEAKEGAGKTPLLLAISTEFDGFYSRKSNEQVVNYLLERGADPHAVDDSGRSAVQLADERHYMFGGTGKFERKPLPPRSSQDWNVGPGIGRGRGRGA
jgi:ankyrin repeat protein